MKKHNFIKYLGVALLATSFVACSEDDETYDSLVKPVVSTAVTDYTIAEGDDLLVTFTSDKAIAESMDFKVEVVGGTVVPAEDLEFHIDEVSFSEGWGTPGYKFAIPAFTNSYTVNLASFIKDAVVDDGETIQFKITASGNLNGGIAGGEQIINVTVGNRAQDLVSLTFDWDQTFDFFGSTYTLCDIAYDIDIIVVDPDGVANYAAATGDCPEVYDLDLTTAAVGDYDFYATVYDNAGLDGAGLDFSIPVTISYQRFGSANLENGGSYTQSAANAYTTATPSDPNAEDASYIATITVNEDGTITISDDGTVIATGRQAQVMNAIKNLKKLNKVVRPHVLN
ncbi:MAG: hypothetical protein EOO50_16180 [Flavobacterium sp.]|uniref:hypothetical protein n=1 Tax=Flavobacterium sp. TaxID=239 RepID=UPI001207F6A2|nr:hypothetical protein [Flavobacterium sp.]RZJ64294.1 MAG: hypothetical protein EOO50_16180 [Flavobacterium sp.]